MGKRIKKALGTSIFLLTLASTSVFAASVSGNLGGKYYYGNLDYYNNRASASTKLDGASASISVDVNLKCYRGNKVINTYSRASNYTSAGVYASVGKDSGTDSAFEANSTHDVYYNGYSTKKNQRISI